MCPPAYRQNGFNPTHALEHMMHDCMMNRTLGEENFGRKKNWWKQS